MRGDQFFQTIAGRPPFTRLHPRLAGFFKSYFANEKAVEFDGRHVINTHFPPYPSPAFGQLVSHFAELGNAATRRLYSVTLAVTNRCPFHCWHCYNSGRSQEDISLAALQNLAPQLQQLGAVMVTITGGEPLLRADLPDIISAFDSRSCLTLGSTGEGLSADLARTLRQRGLFAVGISLDSAQEQEHDRLRGRPGAFQTALRGLRIAREAGLYPYVVTVGTRELLERARFIPFLRFAAERGALEAHVLEPSATGKLAGKTDVLLSGAEREQILRYQSEAAGDESLPIVSSFAYLESPGAFGCGAGLTHIYVDGSGEVCPCNLVPLSFGNLKDAPLETILCRMGQHFCRPREGCVGRMLSACFPRTSLPAPPELSASICATYLPRQHRLPAFFRLQSETRGDDVGTAELRDAYDGVHSDYDDFWLSAAARPIDELISRVACRGSERVFEAGCGTGYATALLARHCAEVLAVDISGGMQSRARKRIETYRLQNVQFRLGDALQELESQTGLDLVFSSWVLGYIPLKQFFASALGALKPGGGLAFVVHRDNSPREALEPFASLVAEDPSVLQRRVAFDFPADDRHLRRLLEPEFEVTSLWEGAAVFQYSTADQVLEHLLKSGAGTAFYEALDPARRPVLCAEFLRRLRHANADRLGFEVRHDCLSCIARKRQSS